MGVLSAWGLAAALQTIRDIRQGRLPLPSEYVASGVAFGAFAVVDNGVPGVGAALSWGLLVAIALQIYQRSPGITDAVNGPSCGAGGDKFPYGRPGVLNSLIPGKVKCGTGGGQQQKGVLA